MIRLYEETYACRLVVLKGAIFGESIALFEDLIFDADPTVDLHLLLASPGGDGEAAVRIVRSAQARCRELTVLVPDQAKSAATLMCMGAHHLVMGPTSDLGPVDPQLRLPNGLVAAKTILGAVETAEKAIQQAPDTYPLHAAMLTDVSGLMVQQARAALARTDDLLMEALMSCPDRTEEEARVLATALKEPLVEQAMDHGALFGVEDARRTGLPVISIEPRSPQWALLWRLYMKYFIMPGTDAYEGRYASKLIRWPAAN